MKKSSFSNGPTSVFGAIKCILVIVFVMFIPTWIYILAFTLLQPVGFWQNFMLFSLGAYFLGVIQFILLVFGTYMIYDLWTTFRNARRREQERAEYGPRNVRT